LETNFAGRRESVERFASAAVIIFPGTEDRPPFLRRCAAASAMLLLRKSGSVIAKRGAWSVMARCAAMTLAAAWLTWSASSARATIVRFTTTVGVVDVRLYDKATPLSVANFLNYSTTQRFDNTFIHRSVPGFIVQGGGYRITTDIFNAVDLPADAPVQNEFGISNLRGTLSYAKLGGNPNSATREWFFNLANNAANLDNQNGGFTVFGRVVGSGMTVVDAIAAKTRVNAGGAFTDLPINNLTKVQQQSNVFIDDVVNITTVTVRNLPAGDYDFNGTVNAADYTVWKNSFGSTTNAAADGNGDGVVNAADYTIWRNTLGQTSSGAGAGGFAVEGVPEPEAMLLLALGGSLVALWRRRR
jgi:peptidyl-prolyl cis-trans isomerase A (cyclophilin A)